MCDSDDIITTQFYINPELLIEEMKKVQVLLKKHIYFFASYAMDLGTIDIGNVGIPTISNDSVNLL